MYGFPKRMCRLLIASLTIRTASVLVHQSESQSTQLVVGCHGVREGPVRWDVVRGDLNHLVRAGFDGSLGRNLRASKDDHGRDPDVSYGDVQLVNHLDRARKLAKILSELRVEECPIGVASLRLFVSSLRPDIPWERWFRMLHNEMEAIVYTADWTDVASSGWPIFAVLSLVQDMHGIFDAPQECGNVDYEFAKEHLEAPGEDMGKIKLQAEKLLRTKPCPFAEAVAELVLSHLTFYADKGNTLPVTASRHFGRAHVAMQRWLPSGEQTDFSKLLSYPLPDLLTMLAGTWRHRIDAGLREKALHMIYCGKMWIKKETENFCKDGIKCILYYKQADLWECPRYYDSVLNQIRQHDGASHTLILSPLQWFWNDNTGSDLRRLIQQVRMRPDEFPIAGLACLNRTSGWHWPVKRIRYQYWKLAYVNYPTGHETSAFAHSSQSWGIGDTTSGTRLYDTSVLLQLVDSLKNRTGWYPEELPNSVRVDPLANDAVEWLVELDLMAKELQIRAQTFMRGQSLENDYTAQAVLTPRLSRIWHVEAARFGPSLPIQEHCLFRTSRLASDFTGDNGVVVSWCIRKKLIRMFQIVGNWWLSLGQRSHCIVPVSASVLNFFRSGELELFPWDADIDANFLAAYPIDLTKLLEKHHSALLALGYTYQLRSDRAVIHDMLDTVRMDIWFSGPQQIEAYDIRARLCGVRVQVFRELLDSAAGYYKPAEKIFGNTRGQLLHCKWAGHNACLPDCVNDGLGVGDDGCEFADNFVKLDVF